MELNEIAERLAKSENARKAFGCFVEMFLEHADGFSGDLKQFGIEFLQDVKTAKRALLHFGVSQNDLGIASLSASEFLKYTAEQIEAKRKRKRERQRKLRAKRTPEQVEADRAKARERMRLVRAKRTPEQKAAAKAWHYEWAKRNRDKLRKYQREYRAKHPKRKRVNGLRQGDLFK